MKTIHLGKLVCVFALLWILEALLPEQAGIQKQGPAAVAIIIAAAVTAGQYALKYLLRPKITQGVSGPESLTGITTARYGQPLGRGYGTVGMPGKWIWRAALAYRYIFDNNIAGQIFKDYQWTVDAGCLICSNPGGAKVKGINRIWMDGSLSYPPFATFTGDAPDVYKLDGVSTPGAVLPIIDGSVNRIRLEATRTGPFVAGGPFAFHAFVKRSICGQAEKFEIRLGKQEQKDIPVDFYETLYKLDWTSGSVGLMNYGVSGFAETPGLAPSYTNRVTLWWENLLLPRFNYRLPQILCEVVFEDDTVGQIIVAECELAGLTAADVDVTAVDGLEVAGYAINDLWAAREVIDILSRAYHFGMPEVDGKLKAVLLNQASSVTIPIGDTGASESGIESNGERVPQFEAIINQASELPKRVDITYLDVARDYQTANGGWGRQISENQGIVTLSWPLVLTSAQAAEIGKVILYSGRAERITYKVKLLPKYIQYHPGDVVTITTKEGYLTDMRIVKMTFAPGGLIEFEGVRLLPSTYTQVGSAAPPLSSIVNVDPDEIVNTEIWMADVPDVRDINDNKYGVLVGVGPVLKTTSLFKGAKEWYGGDVWLNTSGTDETNPTYRWMARCLEAAHMGMLYQDLDSNGDNIYVLAPIGYQYHTMSTEEWDSAKSFNNHIIIGREIVQFKNAEYLLGRTGSTVRVGQFEGWRLYGLRRARRGTHPTKHLKGEPCVLYNNALHFLPLNSSDNGVYNVRAVSIGKQFMDSPIMEFTYEPNSNEFSWAVSWSILNLITANSGDALTMTDEGEVVMV